jgi:hypothetical protein
VENHFANTRKEATALGQLLVEHGYLRSIASKQDDKKFKDST